jgi:hypothetical protein
MWVEGHRAKIGTGSVASPWRGLRGEEEFDVYERLVYGAAGDDPLVARVQLAGTLLVLGGAAVPDHVTGVLRVEQDLAH